MTDNKWLQNHLYGLRLTLKEEIQHVLVSYFAWKPKNFTNIQYTSLLTDEVEFNEAMESIFIIKYFNRQKFFY